MNDTIRYYNENAESYYRDTAEIDFSAAYDRFLKYVPDHGCIVDIGCGSGRDMVAFASRGYHAVGLDASEELARITEEYTGAKVTVCDMATWKAEKPFDGIWCCASLLHLNDEGVGSFFENLKYNLKAGGAIYVSVKSGIETGFDEKGRYMRNFTEDELKEWFNRAGIAVAESWWTGDQLDRTGFCWINMIGIKASDSETV